MADRHFRPKIKLSPRLLRWTALATLLPNLLLSLALNRASRKHEFEADAFAARTTGTPAALADALRRLSVDNLSNLSPHPLLVALEYSHPPVLQRIRALTGQT